jgi:Phage Tail Collar Domain
MIASERRAKLLLGSIAGAAALHLVLAACGHSTTNPAQCQQGNCTTGGSSNGPGFVPPGAVMAYGGTAAPDGWLLCDGSAVSRTQYSALFAAIGSAHGGGDGLNTFQLPDYRGRFLRGVDQGQGRDPDAATRVAAGPGGNEGDAVGSLEADAFRSHDHTVKDPGHGHGVNDPGHAHGVNDPGHAHTGCLGDAQAAGPYTSGYAGAVNAGFNDCNNSMIHPSGTGISIQGSGTNVSIQTATTGISLATSGGSETRPVNASVVWIIKS